MKASIEQKDKRLTVIKSYLQHYEELYYKQTKVRLKYIDKAAEAINDVYWRYADEVVRPNLKGDNPVISVFRISANLELTVMLVMPIEHSDQVERRILNARLSFFISLSLLMEWKSMDSRKCNELFENDSEVKIFVEEHLKWLILLNPKLYFPIFSNSEVWRLFYYLLRDRSNNL